MNGFGRRGTDKNVFSTNDCCFSKTLFSSLFPLQFSGKWTLSQKTSPWPRLFMTRSLCPCRKISKGWVSVQCPDVLMTVTEGRYYLTGGGGAGFPPCHGALEQSSLHQVSRHEGKTAMAPGLPVQLESIQPTRAATLGCTQEWGWGFCEWHGSSQSLQVEKQAEDSPLAKYLHVSEIIFKIFPMLLTSRPFPHHCLKVCTIYYLFISCFHKGRSRSENETEGAIREGFRGGLLGGKRKSYSATN